MNTTIRVNVASAAGLKQVITARGTELSTVLIPPVSVGVSAAWAVTQAQNIGAATSSKATRYTTASGRSAGQIAELATRRVTEDMAMSLRFGMSENSVHQI